MQRLKKLSASIALVACLMVFGSSSSFALHGWGDTMRTANDMSDGSYYQSWVPLESLTDEDWYVYDNSYGQWEQNYYVLLTPPFGLNLQLQYVRTDYDNNIISIQYINQNGPGLQEFHSGTVKPREKAFYRVMPVGPNDFDPNSKYKFEFKKTI
ncbi:hypothetical protein PAALTS15_25069 [Paenibacillus alvei TS-15]|jgi:hypothetical protein|uniref:Uncharacterized protein n=1 Tax=Paenibacillus alvei TS-15 TaxID=1117108 RepID=S9SJW9_PAEAL|nr:MULTISPECIES: hypothetical protein [Paenibacillus]EPY04393.1 hypothetical protein PAALTS15_25069 [Paenibacillus alvei TS-15]MCM3289490.1 hypothetical protein [Paenibacillus sp. MER 180]GAV10852.1 hypothetical protein PBN151_0779 [Paenibacillus sp. NAIST15-1]